MGEKMDIKVSVIIPVYNSEKYLEECIESLLGQTLKECEFIFVNDGSKDNSYNILKKYEKLDRRIKIINQKNQGSSMARNSGLNIARGKYIGFIDSDDYIDKEYYSNLYKIVDQNNADIVLCNWKTKNNQLNLPFKKNEIWNKEYIQKEVHKFMLRSDSLNSVCNKLFLSELIKKNKITFPNELYMGEDARFNIRAFTYADTAYYLDYSGYFYREVIGSVTRNICNRNYFERSLMEYKEDVEEFNMWKIDKSEIAKLRTIKFVNNVLSLCYLYFNEANDITLHERFKYINNMISNKVVIDVFNNYNDEIFKNRGRYEKVVLRFIKGRFSLGIYLATLYSKKRNNRGK